MGLYGSNIYTRRGTASKTLKGFAGSRIYYAGIPVVVRNKRGRGLANVTLMAPNTVSGNSFEGTTDGNGSAIMVIDENSDLHARKGSVTTTITRGTENQLVVILDTELMQGI